MGFAPSARTEAAIFVKHMLAEKPDTGSLCSIRTTTSVRISCSAQRIRLATAKASQLTTISRNHLPIRRSTRGYSDFVPPRRTP